MARGLCCTGSGSAFAYTGGDAIRARTPAALAPVRQRAKLWELNASVHCSIIGTCLTTGELRRTMGRFAHSDVGHLSDHDLHAEAVSLAGHNNACSKLLNKTLDQRHLLVVKQYGRIAGEPAVMARWREACAAGDIPGAYWAVLTHPDVGLTGIRQAFGEVHMLSHLIGSANRADLRRLAVLEAEKAALLDKVERQQTRLRDADLAREATLRQIGALAIARGQPAGPVEDDALAGYRQVVADLEARLAVEAGRRGRLEARLAATAQAAQHRERQAAAAAAERDAMARELRLLERPGDAAAAPSLPDARVLYVGGRSGCVTQIRDALVQAGGALLAHDGGRHDHPSLLPGLVSQADRVVFPVDCVSHDAALAVKRLCRQSGKPWSALRSSGLASFLAAFASPQ